MLFFCFAVKNLFRFESRRVSLENIDLCFPWVMKHPVHWLLRSDLSLIFDKSFNFLTNQFFQLQILTSISAKKYFFLLDSDLQWLKDPICYTLSINGNTSWNFFPQNLKSVTTILFLLNFWLQFMYIFIFILVVTLT